MGLSMIKVLHSKLPERRNQANQKLLGMRRSYCGIQREKGEVYISTYIFSGETEVTDDLGFE